MEGDIINERNVCTWKKSQIRLKIKHEAWEHSLQVNVNSFFPVELRLPVVLY